MKLLIKNMVCQRCITAVSNILAKNDFQTESIRLGEVELTNTLSLDQIQKLNDELIEEGFELIDDRQSQLINKVKSLVIDQIHHSDNKLRSNWSDYLSDQLNHEYKYLSHLFSSTEGMTIEQYIIRQKIEKVKEMIRYDQLSLSQIAYQLDYSSVAHLSAQFKKITGMTPSTFKQIGERKALDKV
ncbi:AraC family transcriptional regulator [Marinoscillum sp. MHG1-6]|uniref:helix-turn-helix domain-containing protein n=1 Tax=Marinoscillum sp. MHG1-6 TaxID=2959627 RepID=UPI002157CCAC|nr:helix-turn-helix transcriptional regulator [Marinoscillum sp. MHG1-6]